MQGRSAPREVDSGKIESSRGLRHSVALWTALRGDFGQAFHKKVEEKVVLSRPTRSTIAGPTRTGGGDDMGAARSAHRVERGASARDTEKCYRNCFNPVTETVT